MSVREMHVYKKTEELLYKVYLQKRILSKQKAEQILNSWKGHAQHGNSHNFIQRLLKQNDYIYQNSKGTLKIDMSKILKEVE